MAYAMSFTHLQYSNRKTSSMLRIANYGQQLKGFKFTCNQLYLSVA